MAASAEFIAFLKEQMAGFADVTHKRMFGGAGLYRDGLIFALVIEEALYLKADAENRAQFEAEDLQPFTYQTKHGGKTVMSYWRSPERCLDDADAMTEWCRIAWGAALRGRAPKPKGKSKRLDK